MLQRLPRLCCKSMGGVGVCAHSVTLSWLCRIEEVRRETADAEQRAGQLEAELQRLTRAQKEREDDLERKMDALNRRANARPYLPLSPRGLARLRLHVTGQKHCANVAKDSHHLQDFSRDFVPTGR